MAIPVVTNDKRKTVAVLHLIDDTTRRVRRCKIGSDIAVTEQVTRLAERCYLVRHKIKRTPNFRKYPFQPPAGASRPRRCALG